MEVMSGIFYWFYYKHNSYEMKLQVLRINTVSKTSHVTTPCLSACRSKPPFLWITIVFTAQALMNSDIYWYAWRMLKLLLQVYFVNINVKLHFDKVGVLVPDNADWHHVDYCVKFTVTIYVSYCSCKDKTTVFKNISRSITIWKCHITWLSNMKFTVWYLLYFQKALLWNIVFLFLEGFFLALYFISRIYKMWQKLINTDQIHEKCTGG